MNTQEQFNELNQITASLDTRFKEIVAKSKTSAPDAPSPQDCMEAMYAMVNHIHSRISSLADDMYGYQNNHQSGHLPKIVGADKMNKALAALGLDGDYQAEKKSIYASKDLFTITNK